MKNFDLPIIVESIIYYVDKHGVRNYLAIKRCLEDGGFWQPVTGTLESGENLEDCLFREIEEEIGLSKKDVISVSNCIYHFTWTKKIIGEVNEYVFAVEVQSEFQVKLSTEHVEYRWGKKEEIKNLYKMNDNKIALDKI